MTWTAAWARAARPCQLMRDRIRSVLRALLVAPPRPYASARNLGLAGGGLRGDVSRAEPPDACVWFARRYGREPEGAWFAPGRVNLIGGLMGKSRWCPDKLAAIRSCCPSTR